MRQKNGFHHHPQWGGWHCSKGHGSFGGFDDDDDIFDGGGHRGGRGGGFGFGRVFERGALKLLLLALIEEQPSHGYQLIHLIEEQCGHTYSPSPGTVYPTLSMLEDMGYASVETSEGRKLYTITDEGRAFLDENRDAIEAIRSRMSVVAHMRAKMDTPRTLRKSVRKIKKALMLHGRRWTPEELERVEGILARAADEIAAGGKEDA